MKNIRSTELQTRIKELEAIEVVQRLRIKDNVRIIKDRLKPANIVKSSLKGILAPQNIKSTAMKAALIGGMGFIAKKIIARKLKRNIGSLGLHAAKFLTAFIVSKKLAGRAKSIV